MPPACSRLAPVPLVPPTARSSVPPRVTLPASLPLELRARVVALPRTLVVLRVALSPARSAGYDPHRPLSTDAKSSPPPAPPPRALRSSRTAASGSVAMSSVPLYSTAMWRGSALPFRHREPIRSAPPYPPLESTTTAVRSPPVSRPAGASAPSGVRAPHRAQRPRPQRRAPVPLRSRRPYRFSTRS